MYGTKARLMILTEDLVGAGKLAWRFCLKDNNGFNHISPPNTQVVHFHSNTSAVFLKHDSESEEIQSELGQPTA